MAADQAAFWVPFVGLIAAIILFSFFRGGWLPSAPEPFAPFTFANRQSHNRKALLQPQLPEKGDTNSEKD